MRVDRNAVGIAVRGGSRNLLEGMGGGSEVPDPVGAMLGEPDIAMLVDHHSPGQRVGGRHLPLRERIVGRIIHFQRVAHRSGEPEIARAVKGSEERLPVARRKLNRLYPPRRGDAEFLDFARWRTATACRVRVATRYGQPDIAVVVDSRSPRIAAAGYVEISRRNGGPIGKAGLHRVQQQANGEDEYKKGAQAPG